MVWFHIISTSLFFDVKPFLIHYLSEFLRWGLMSNILCVIFRTVVLIFNVVCSKKKQKKNVTAAVSSGLPKVSLVYLGMEMI